jgi:hypothetical protein
VIFRRAWDVDTAMIGSAFVIYFMRKQMESGILREDLMALTSVTCAGPRHIRISSCEVIVDPCRWLIGLLYLYFFL